ncbi:MAG: peptidoglycan DD-metalloendopeptidase family protein [Mesorhizobium sp.]
MQLSVLKTNRRNLARGCAVLMVAGMAAGCSSQVARFGDGLDSVSTASTANQRSIIGQQDASQPFPGDSIEPAPVQMSQSAPVSRSSLPAPVSAQPLPPVQQAQAAPMAQKPIHTASAEMAPAVDRTVKTGTVTKPFQSAEVEAPRLSDNQPRQKATEIVVESGQTISGLSHRYGVPSDVIMKANGLSETNGLKAGSKIVIPAYGYSVKRHETPVVADNKSLNEKAPVPAARQAEKVAVLPEQPRLKDGKAKPQLDASADTNDPFIVSKGEKPATKTASAEPKAKASVPGTYTVQSGDTLSAISRKTGVSTAALKQANGMSDGLIRIGQTLTIPSGATAPATVASAKPVAVDPVKTASTPPAAKTTPTETLASYTPPKKEKIIQAAAEDDAVAPDSTGIGKMRWPVRGRVISGFGSGKDGDGIDISVPEGTPVKAAENGVVIYAGNGLKEFGNTVLVRHEDGLVTVYGHASSLEVTRGQKVKRGQEIALSGMSGTTDSPKLHFEVRKNSSPVDPRKFLE